MCVAVAEIFKDPIFEFLRADFARPAPMYVVVTLAPLRPSVCVWVCCCVFSVAHPSAWMLGMACSEKQSSVRATSKPSAGRTAQPRKKTRIDADADDHDVAAGTGAGAGSGGAGDDMDVGSGGGGGGDGRRDEAVVLHQRSAAPRGIARFFQKV